MDSLLPSPEEVSLFSDMIEEGHRLYGTPVSLIYPDNFSMYLDNPQFCESIQVRLLLRENPSKKILVNLGWWSEDKKTSSLIGYLPFTLNSSNLVVVDGCVLVYPDKTALQVKAVNRQFLYGYWQVLNLVPHVVDNREVIKTQHNIKTQLLRQPREEVL